jgi:hypothetical protein
LCTTLAVAHESQAQEVLNRSVTIVGQNINFKSVLAQIEKQAEVKFVYSTRVQINQKMSLNLQKAKLSAVLNEILNPNSISYEVIENRILLTKTKIELLNSSSLLNKQESESLMIDPKTIKGKIIDESGSPIPGVNILIKGTNKGVSSNIDGTYNLSVSDDKAILAFSFVGFITQEVLVGNRSMINISLVSENKALTEVVVVGYGTARVKDLTGAVATINQNTIKDLPVSTVDQKMIGQVAGMHIQQ